MEKPRKKVSARKFVQDFRAGKTDEELMEIYGLDRKNLNKLFKKLMDKELLDPTEVRIHKTRDRTGDSASQEASVDLDSSDHSIPRAVGVVEYEETEGKFCSQCGAPAPEKALTCPQCGHVLPGTRRWEEVEPKQSIIERIPPLAWGIIVAIPVGIALYLFFAYYLVPAMSKETDRRVEAIRKETGGLTPQEAAARVAAAKYRNALRAEVSRLISLDIFSEVEPDYSVFKAGAMWAGLSQEDRRRHLTSLAATMRSAQIQVNFEVVDDAGWTIATVNGFSINLVEEESSIESFEAGLFEKKKSPRRGGDPTLEELERQADPKRRARDLEGLPTSE